MRQSRLAPVGRGQEQDDLGLERVGVLELVDEDALKSRLEIAAHLVNVAHEVPRAQQQIEEVERASAHLQLLISLDAAAQLVAQQRRKIRIRVHREAVKCIQQRLVCGVHVRPRNALAEGRAVAFPRAAEITIPTQID